MGELGVCICNSVLGISKNIAQDNFFSSADLNTQNRCCVLSAVLLQEYGTGGWAEMWSKKLQELEEGSTEG